MSATSHAQANLRSISNANVRERVIGKLWDYLDDNFHKLTDANKLKVIVAICGKTIPQEVVGMNQQVVVVNEIIKNNKPHRYNIGSPDPTASQADTQFTGEALPDS